MEDRNVHKIDSEVQKMIKILENEQENYIFGCGWMGQKFLAAIRALNIPVSGFVVTDKHLNEIEGVPIFSTKELSDKHMEANIFVALRDQDEHLQKELENIFSTVYLITYPGDIALIEAKYYLEYFREKNIDCLGDIIHLGKYGLINPFKKKDDYLLSWVYEAGDLLLPTIYDDYQRIDEGSYETEYTKLTSGDIVLDCGANIGLFSVIAAQKGCTCYAFEPMPDAISYLEEVSQLYTEQIKIMPYALSDQEGEAIFHVQNNDLIGASLLENHNVIDKDYKVKVTTIDKFVQQEHLQQVDYIKADIEGSERDMLKGAADTIKRFCPKISICTYHLADDKEVLENIIKEINPNYKIMHKWKKLYAYIP